MNKIWNIIGEREDDRPLVESIFLSKGITNPDEINEFLSDKPKNTYDPFLIKNMHEAVEKIIKNIQSRNKIIIFGDYDVDGVSSTALLVEFFKNLTDNIDYYIPNRFSEGYGLNKEAISYIKEEMKGNLIITVDNGISSFDEVSYAKEIGLDIIVTDHHNPPEELPQCIVLNVKQEKDIYPFKDLCGCGIAFKLAQAIQRKLNLSKDIISKLLDLTALGTIADLVPLIDENRTIVKYGLRRMNQNKRIGLEVLREIIGLKNQEINAGKIGYNIGPCFNAAGRIENARLGVQLLLEKNKDKAEEIAKNLNQLNLERQKIQKEGEKKCIELVEEEYLESDFLILQVEGLSEGVIGIIAGRMKDLYYKPTLVITKSEEGYYKGSGRSIKGINIYQEMKKVEDLFLSFGGHEMACGFSINEEKIGILRKKLDSRAKEIKLEDPDIFVPKINIVAEMKATELKVNMIKEISKLEPYGMGNPKPLFIMKDVRVNNNWTKPCGSENIHLKFSGEKDNSFLNGIGFSLAEKFYFLESPKSVDIAFEADINQYNGKIKPQMIIKDLRKA